jgi:acetyl esterase
VPLDPEVLAMRERSERAGTRPLYTMSLREARAADLAAIQAASGGGEPVHEVIDLTIPGPDGDLPARLYRPDPAPGKPVLVYFFGGGWTLGSIETSDGICRTLANSVPCQVITVGYRLAPEHRFPAAVRDCYAATGWIASHAGEIGADPARLAVAGDSAGGNLAAVVCLLARDRSGPPLAAQVLVYPNTDYRGGTLSMRDNDDPALFNRRSVAWYWTHYLSTPDDGLDPLVSPLLAEDLAGLPPALVITAEYDPLRDEGEAYAERLRAAGVPVQATRYDGMIHGFFAMSGILDAGKRALAEVALYLEKHLR